MNAEEKAKAIGELGDLRRAVNTHDRNGESLMASLVLQMYWELYRRVNGPTGAPPGCWVY